MKRLRLAAIIACLVVAAACSAATESTTTTQTVVADSTSSTTAAVVGTSTVTGVPPPSSTSPSSTPPSTTAPPVSYAPLGRTPVLPDGRPETFVAVTDDFRVVEVDTLTGSILDAYNDAPVFEDSEDELQSNVYTAVWRSSDGAQLMISSCCEPAGGALFLIESSGTLADKTVSDYAAWASAPAPDADAWAMFGYLIDVLAPELGETLEPVESQGEGLAFGYAAWSRDLSRIYWLSRQPVAELPIELSSWDGVSNQIERIPLPWLTDGDVQGLVTQASGNLVLFVTSQGGETTGTVMTPSGELVAEFSVEPGSSLGSYDTSGTHLIYVDGEGNVRWQGGGGSGILASGFIHASW